MTTMFGIVGDPVAQVRSPQVFNALFRAKGIDAIMVPMHVVPEAFERTVDGLRGVKNLGGLVITVPHKFAAATLLSVRSHRVEITGAANALCLTDQGWAGDLFDGEGFAKGLESRHMALSGKRCAIVGAGGAGTAIALALVDRHVRELRIWDLDPMRANTLKDRLADSTNIPIAVSLPSRDDDIAINASPVGMVEGDGLPFDPGTLRRDALVCEAIMKPPKTRLLVEAERLGHPIQEGRHMLDHQVDSIWQFFRL